MKSLDISAADKASTDPTAPEQYLTTDHLKVGLKGRTARGGAATIASEGFRQLLHMVSIVVLARLLTPAETGLVAMAFVVTGFLEWFKDLGLSAATIQRAQIDQRQVSTLFWINVAFGFGLTMFTIALAPAVAWLFREPRLVGITIVLACSFIFTGPALQHKALLKRQMHFKLLAVLAVVSMAVSTAVGIAAALAGFSYWSLVLMRVVVAPIELLVLWIAYPWRPGRPGRLSEVRSMLAFGGNVTGHKLLLYLTRNVDNLLIGWAYGDRQLGLYTKAYSILLLPLNQINTPVAAVAVPALSRLTDTSQRYRDAYLSIVAKVCLLTMPLVAFMISTSDWLVLLVLGPQWIEASTMFIWLGISGLVEPFTSTTSWLFLTQNRTREQLRWGFVSSILMILAFLAGLPWGPVGVAAAYGFTSLFIRAPLLLWYVGRAGPVSTRDLYRSAAPFACAACAVVLAVVAFRWWIDVPHPLVGLLSAGGITAAVTLLTLAIVPGGRPTLRELKSMPSLLLRRKQLA